MKYKNTFGKISFFLFYFLYSNFLISQELKNFIPNCSFEFNKGLPTSYAQSNLLDSWYSFRINCAPVTYFHSLSFKPKRIVGYNQLAHSGNGFIGLGIDLGDKLNYSQFIETPLINPLLKDSTYQLTIYACIGNNFKYYIDHLEGFFFENKIIYSTRLGFRKNEIIYLKPEQECCYNAKKWTKLTATYKARGDENYFALGNFSFSYKKNRMPFKFTFLHFISKQMTYYFIDDVSIIETFQSSSIKNSLSLLKKTKDTLVTKYEVRFNYNDAVISSKSEITLNDAMEFIKDKDILYINIYGFTDQFGIPLFNDKLSERRANIVYDYFVKAGLNISKVRYAGKGMIINKPTATNNTIRQPHKNRKVEVTIYYQNN